MRRLNHYLLFFFTVLISSFVSCNKDGNTRRIDIDTVKEDTARHYIEFDPEKENLWNQFFKAMNLLEFHTRDTMKTDSTYVATLSMGKKISSAELESKVAEILEPGGQVKVRDTSQEISTYMKATLEDKASDKDPNFNIKLLGGESNMRKYDEKKNKMVWQWNVTPRKEGHHDLILSISHVDAEGNLLGSPETRRHSITIFSSRKKPGLFSGIGNFLGNYWQWLLGVVALPIFIAWFTTKRRIENQKAATGIPLKTNPVNWKRKRRNRQSR